MEFLGSRTLIMEKELTPEKQRSSAGVSPVTSAKMAAIQSRQQFHITAQKV